MKKSSSKGEECVHCLAHPEIITSYFTAQWPILAIITVTGLVYNIGLLAGPYYEGQMAQCLLDISRKDAAFSDMLRLVLTYLLVILLVQGSRFVKRFYVRRFANNTARSMKEILYGNLVHHTKQELDAEGSGNLITKAVSDADDCAEGMRKFTTELFDTGVALISYTVFLLSYDWRLALLCLLFPPVSYVLAERMKTIVQRTGAAAKESSGRLSQATLDRVSGAMTYRVYGCEEARNKDYEDRLADYEKTGVLANVFVSAMPPIYQVISMVSVLFILWFGGRNVTGTGWTAWNVAAFTAFLSSYTKLAVKSSHAAKLFNAVQKAQVSWRRILPFLKAVPDDPETKSAAPGTLSVQDLGVTLPGGRVLFSGLSITAAPGDAIGVTGPVACGKSSLGRAFLFESPCSGTISWNGQNLCGLSPEERNGIVGYLGHDPELFDGTIEDNVLLGRKEDVMPYLKAVCLDKEVAAMEEGIHTRIGPSGNRLSGGQQKRLALARTLALHRPLYVLDDPFSALDRDTERKVFANIRALCPDSTLLYLSHRLELFPQMKQVLFMKDGTVTVSTHEALLQTSPDYAQLVALSGKGGQDNA